MATKNLFNPNDDQNNPNKSTSLESGVIGGTETPNDNGGSAAKGTSWTNLQTYLDTNKGAGNAIADAQLAGINSEIGATNTAVDDWANKANQNVNKGIKQDTWSSKVKGQSSDQISQNFGGQQAQAFDAWKKLETYTGPQSAESDEGYQDAYNKSQATKGKIDSANTYEGQQQLSKDAFGKDNNRYSTGMGALDTFVGRADAGNKYDSFKANNANFGDKITNQVGNVNNSIAQGKAQGVANQKGVMDAISQRLGELQGGVDANKIQTADVDKQKGYLRGIVAPSGQKLSDEQINGMVSAGNYDPSDLYSDADLSAINTLAGIDDNASTNAFARAGKQQNASLNNGLLDKWLSENPTPKPVTESPQSVGGSSASKAIDIMANPEKVPGQVVQGVVDQALSPSDPVSQAVNNALDNNGLGRLKPKNPFKR